MASGATEMSFRGSSFYGPSDAYQHPEPVSRDASRFGELGLAGSLNHTLQPSPFVTLPPPWNDGLHIGDGLGAGEGLLMFGNGAPNGQQELLSTDTKPLFHDSCYGSGTFTPLNAFDAQTGHFESGHFLPQELADTSIPNCSLGPTSSSSFFDPFGTGGGSIQLPPPPPLSPHDHTSLQNILNFSMFLPSTHTFGDTPIPTVIAAAAARVDSPTLKLERDYHGGLPLSGEDAYGPELAIESYFPLDSNTDLIGDVSDHSFGRTEHSQSGRSSTRGSFPGQNEVWHSNAASWPNVNVFGTRTDSMTELHHNQWTQFPSTTMPQPVSSIQVRNSNSVPTQRQRRPRSRRPDLKVETAMAAYGGASVGEVTFSKYRARKPYIKIDNMEAAMVSYRSTGVHGGTLLSAPSPTLQRERVPRSSAQTNPSPPTPVPATTQIIGYIFPRGVFDHLRAVQSSPMNEHVQPSISESSLPSPPSVAHVNLKVESHPNMAPHAPSVKRSWSSSTEQNTPQALEHVGADAVVDKVEELPSAPSAPEKKRIKRPANNVSKACFHCQKAHLCCDIDRPCRRCYGRGLDCYDVESKRRGRPKTYREEEVYARAKARAEIVVGAMSDFSLSSHGDGDVARQ
ncbi:hypothetical protein M427DRAFT_506832 [Gonapodya prolifera JEL478]|uniref:Zn(2)-C6 fungal-type domain-containing protein n=1 Tax=Gonapodya prolifera (strain JEL478) TaxID=1344416 RepID=A0A139A2U9_GONPJ|nr:hypothetical protein M427DRAFT_506832 [Gonapodya prolifera JEL478]|eukprot:KXS10978.1 hypothetical protein M427DRAFT_506832 [Gonapodya prolifera JEL478]